MNSQSGKSRNATNRLARNDHRQQVVVKAFVATMMAIFCVVIISNSMGKDVARDEQMYCTAGALLAQGKMIYRDFSYPSQLPYHPLLLAVLYRLSGTTHYLLVGRLTSVLCDILVVIGIVGIYRSVFGAYRLQGLLFGVATTTLYLFNPLVDYALGYAWNHDVVILCVILSLWLFVTTDFQAKSRFWRMAVMGALLTVATFMRVTTILVELLFLAAVLWAAGGTLKNRIVTALPFVLAALVAMIWPIWIIAQAPEAFRLNLVRIPTLYGQWLHEVKMTFDKLSLTIASLTTVGYLILLILIGYLLAAVLRHPSRLDAQEKRKAIFAALLPLVFFVIAYIPPTIWQQYLAVPVPFVVIGLAYPLASLLRGAQKPEGKGRYRLAAWLVRIGAVVAVLAYPVVLYRGMFILVPENWTPIQLHKTSQEIAAKVPQPRLVLTLGPLYAIEGGCDIYPEFSCGSIVYRIADVMTPDERQITHTVGPKTLDVLLTTAPPAAVIAGVEPSYFASLEEPLRRSVPSNWHREVYGDKLQVYVRP